MKSIAVLTDFSEESKNATKYAIALAQALIAKLVVIHVGHSGTDVMGTTASASGLAWADPTLYTPSTAAFEAERLEEEKRNLKELVSEIRHSVAPDQLVEDVFLMGAGIDVSLDYLREHPVGLVVMGTKGADTAVDRWVGSNTSYLMDKAPCPVLAVPGHSSYTGLQKVVFAADPHNETQWHIEELNAIASTFNAEVTVLYVQENESDVASEDRWIVFSQKLELQSPKFKFVRIQSDALAQSLEAYAKAKSADVLIAAKQNRSFMENLFHTSVTSRLAHDSVLPLLTLPAPADGKERPQSIFTM